tara:strand:- start:65 stop:670 length:606 start_codon:yes stop_codon:yes gene_type:complete
MVWQKETVNGMVKDWFFRVVFTCFLPACLFAQNSNNAQVSNSGFKLKFQSMVLFSYDDDGYRVHYLTDYELEDYTSIFGLNVELSHLFDNDIGIGLGYGCEEINQPNFLYHPIYLIAVINDEINSLYARVNFGTHLGDLDQSGFLFRGGLGFRFKIYKKIHTNFDITYSYQNMYKTFANSERPENYYFIESIGLTIGIEFN